MTDKSYADSASEKLGEFIDNPKPVLAIESSCDETAAAVVYKRQVLSNVVHSQIDLHKKYGGVVPELASRDHVTRLPQVVAEAVKSAGLNYNDFGAVAVTKSPGLVGALLTGVSFAKGLAYALSLPLVGVNHINGHIAANYITHSELCPPFTCLVASGGHSHIYNVRDYNTLELLGSSRDDAAGEAFDKIARILGLGYPGGPALERLAKDGDEHAYTFTGGFNASDGPDFSFSGLKTAAINILNQANMKNEPIKKEDLAASFQYAIVTVLTRKSILAAKANGGGTLALCGGVSANRALVSYMQEQARKSGLSFVWPALKYCGDNAAMIGCAAYYELMNGKLDGLDLNASAV